MNELSKTMVMVWDDRRAHSDYILACSFKFQDPEANSLLQIIIDFLYNKHVKSSEELRKQILNIASKENRNNYYTEKLIDPW